ncbi:trypsin-like peptidase domain-containing protein [Streptomyces sp. NBC_00012]|uniref:trypsin-like peptidase domain-containing protein n=1 Tax=Streptomyces sp. NBC_00012 TaxID=2975621 RepID=UPI0032528735
MDADRVVQVGVRHDNGRTCTGSGYVIAPRLVLTAAHLFGKGNTAAGLGTVSGPAERRRSRVRVLWRRLDGPVDAALLEVTDPRWRPPASCSDQHPQRWGRLVTTRSGQPVVCCGFPRMQAPRSGGRHLEQLSTRVNPLTGAPAARYELSSSTGPFGPLDSGDSPYSGMSGAAVFDEPKGHEADPLLLGVVSADRLSRTGVRLTATRSEDLLADPGFRRIIAEHSGVRPDAEPVELARMLEPAAPRLDVRSPLMLLRADAEAVAFRGREETLAELLAWCEGRDSTPVRVLVGPGGQGKTRLARQLAAELRARGWVAGHLRRELADNARAATTDLRPLNDLCRHALVVIDYAETQPGRVQDFVKRALRERGHRFRVLLLARSAGTWKSASRGADAHVHDLLHVAPLTHLLPLDTTTEGHTRAFGAAVNDLARALGRVRGHNHVRWDEVARRVPVPSRPGTAARTPDQHRPEAALTVQMNALEALLQSGPRPVDAVGGAPHLVLQHEVRYWEESAVALLGLGTHQLPLLKSVVAAAVLCGAADRAEAVATVARVPGVPPDLHAPLAGWLRELYPAPPDRYWGQLHPDRVAEFHASTEVLDAPDDLLLPLFQGGSDSQRIHLLDVLTRAVVGHANARRSERATDVLDRLNHVLDEVPVGVRVLQACSDALPEHSHVLTRFSARVAEALNTACLSLPGTPDVVLARAHHNLAHRYAALGRRHAAIDAATDAMALRRVLAEDEPGTHDADLARTYSLYARCLKELERHQPAADYVKRALRLHERLDHDDPLLHRPDLVRALHTAAWILRDHDRQESNLAAGKANELSNWLEREQPGLHRDLLALSLSGLGVGYWHEGRYQESVRAAEKAVSLTRTLAATAPDAHTPALASALNSLAVAYDDGRATESVTLLNEAIAYQRSLADDLPDAHHYGLARSLHNLGISRRSLGEHGAGLRALEEAESIRAQLARAAPDQRNNRALGHSRHSQAVALVEEERLQEAAEKFQHALDAYRRVHPQEVTDDALLADTLYELGKCRGMLGQPSAAVRALQESVTIRRELTAADPATYEGELCNGLIQLSYHYEQAGQDVAQRILLREALVLMRPMYRTDPGTWAELLAWCLSNLGADPPDARQVIPLLEEAVALYDGILRDRGDEATRVALLLALARLRNAQGGAGRHRAAVRTGLRLLETAARADARPAIRRATDHAGLASAYSRAGAHAEARAHSCRAVALSRATLAEGACEPGDLAWHLLEQARILELGSLRGGWHTKAAALAPARESLALYGRLARSDPAGYAASRREASTVVAGLLLRLGRVAESDAVRHRHAQRDGPGERPPSSGRRKPTAEEPTRSERR